MKILLIAGHGQGYMSNDPGAVANGYNERDFNRKYILPTVASYLKEAGHSVSLYGGKAMGQDCYQDTAYGQAVGDYKNYGMYWISRQGYDVVVEFHLDAASPAATGGHVIISSSFSPDSIDKNLHNAIKKHVGTIRDIDGRNNLLNVNVAAETGVNYRLLELGFITSKKDMDYISKNYKAYCKDIADAINGKEIVIMQTVKKAPKKVVKKKVSSIKNTYRVKKGDSLWLIATNNKLTVDQLKKLNGLTDNLIFEGQVLKIKK